MKYYTIAGKHDRNHLVSIVLSAFQMRLMKYTSSIGCKVCDEGFVFEKIVSSAIQVFRKPRIPCR